MSPRDQGYQAFLDDLGIDDNPHSYGSDAWNDWHEGYMQAKEEEESQ